MPVSRPGDVARSSSADAQTIRGDQHVKTAFSFTVVASCLAGTIAVAGPQYGPGVTDTEIKLGQTLPYSGAVSAIGIPMAGATQALLRKVNQAGGGDGRENNLSSLDD